MLHNDPGVASAIAWHFAAMWLLLLSYLGFMVWGIVTGHFWRDYLPVGPKSFWRDFSAAARFKLAHSLGEYNAVQRVFYWGALGAVAMMVLSGIAIWKPVQTYPLEVLFGGFQGARLVHFLFMTAIVLFLDRARRLGHPGAENLRRHGAGQSHRSAACPPSKRPSGNRAYGRRNMSLQRRELFRGSLSLGALTMLTGCDVSDHESVQRALGVVSAWNDRVQAAIFGQNRLAPTFPETDGGQGFSLQCLVRAGQGSETRRRRLPADAGGTDRRQAPLDGGTAARVAAGQLRSPAMSASRGGA